MIKQIIFNFLLILLSSYYIVLIGGLFVICLFVLYDIYKDKYKKDEIIQVSKNSDVIDVSYSDDCILIIYNHDAHDEKQLTWALSNVPCKLTKFRKDQIFFFNICTESVSIRSLNDTYYKLNENEVKIYKKNDNAYINYTIDILYHEKSIIFSKSIKK